MSNITVSTSFSNLSVNTESNTISVTSTPTNVIVGNTFVVTESQIRSAISVTDTGGDGSLTYSNVTGVFTYTGSSDADKNTWLATRTTDNLTESASNLYFTTGRANSAIGAYQGDINTAGNITAASFSGDGGGLSNVSTLTNAQAQAFIEANGLDMTSAISSDSNITTTANVTAGNVIVTTPGTLFTQKANVERQLYITDPTNGQLIVGQNGLWDNDGSNLDIGIGNFTMGGSGNISNSTLTISGDGSISAKGISLTANVNNSYGLHLGEDLGLSGSNAHLANTQTSISIKTTAGGGINFTGGDNKRNTIGGGNAAQTSYRPIMRFGGSRGLSSSWNSVGDAEHDSITVNFEPLLYEDPFFPDYYGVGSWTERFPGTNGLNGSFLTFNNMQQQNQANITNQLSNISPLIISFGSNAEPTGPNNSTTSETVGIHSGNVYVTNLQGKPLTFLKSFGSNTDVVNHRSESKFYGNLTAGGTAINVTSTLNSTANIDTTANVNSASFTTTANATVGANLNVLGNLEVTGNINYREVEDLLVQDQTITLNYGNASANDVQIISDRSGSGDANTDIKWNETSDTWTFTNDGSTYYAIPTSTSDLAEGTNLYFTAARARGNISVGTPASASGGGSLAYDSGTGEFTFTPADTQTDSEVRALISVGTPATPSGNGSLAYDNSTGVFTLTPADVPDTTDELTEGSTNLYYTSARADADIADYTGAIINMTGNLTTTANIQGGKLVGTEIDSNAQIATTGNINVGNILNFAGNTATTTSPKIKYEGALGDGQLTFIKSIANAETNVGIFDSSEASYDLANTAIGGVFGVGNIVVDKDLVVDGSTANITTTANISAGNVLTDNIESGSSANLNLKGQADGIHLDTTVASAETRIVDIDTTGYSVSEADFGSANVTTDNVPAMYTVCSGTSGTNTLTVSTQHPAGLYAIQQVGTGYTGFGAFGQPSLQAALGALGANLTGWYLFEVGGSTVSLASNKHYVTGISGSTITLSENLTKTISGAGVILFPGAYSTTQNLGFALNSDTSVSTNPFNGTTVRYNDYTLPQTLSNVTLDAVSYSDATVDLANVIMRHSADLDVGTNDAIRTERLLLIGANATPDVLSVGVDDVFPGSTALGLTLENDGDTYANEVNTAPQMKFLMNQYTENALSSFSTYPLWTEFIGETGDANVDMKYLGAPQFNFKLLGGTKADKKPVKSADVLGRIGWNSIIPGVSSGADVFHPPASIVARAPGDSDAPANLTLANTDMHFQSTYSTSYRNGANTTGGTIPRTFISSSEGNTIIAAKTDGKVTLRPVRDYGDTGTATSFVENRFAHELHEYHEFLGAGFLGSKAGTLVEIQPKSGETGGSTDFNYDSKGNATLRLSTHEANNTVKKQWDITSIQSSGNLLIRDHTNDTTVMHFDGSRVFIDESLRLQNLTTIEINAIASPQAGDVVYNTTLNQICFYNGTAWQKVTSATM